MIGGGVAGQGAVQGTHHTTHPNTAGERKNWDIKHIPK